MNTIGQIINSARNRKKLSFKKIEEITKIKSSFIESLEKEKWNELPPFPIVLGFLKSISSPLGIDEKMAIAVLKRDYPPRKININPKPDVASKFSWSPKLTFTIGIVAIVLIILGYLGFQYFKFISPPDLTVESPKDGQVVEGNSVLVFGTTDRDAKITVNNQPVLTDQNGKFSVDIGIAQDTKEIIVKAISRSGKERVVSRKIIVQ